MLPSVTTYATYCAAALPAGPVPANGPGVLMWSRQVPLFGSRVLLGVRKVSSLSTPKTLQSPERHTQQIQRRVIENSKIRNPRRVKITTNRTSELRETHLIIPVTEC